MSRSVNPRSTTEKFRTMELRTMDRRILGRTGLAVTQLGYGSMGLRGPRTWGVRVVSDHDAERFLNAVLDAGINFIDTSPDYGASEVFGIRAWSGSSASPVLCRVSRP